MYFPSDFCAHEQARNPHHWTDDEDDEIDRTGRIFFFAISMAERADKPLIMLPGPATSAAVSKFRTGEANHALAFRSRHLPRSSKSVSQARVTGRSSDLSIGGCYVDTLSPFACRRRRCACA